MQTQDRKQHVQGLDVFLHPEFHAVILNFQVLVVIGGEGFVNFVAGVEVSALRTRLRVRHCADAAGRDDDALFPKSELGNEAIIADVQRVERVHGVGVDADAEGTVIVQIVGNGRSVVGKQRFRQAADLRLRRQVGIQGAQRVLDAQNVLIAVGVLPGLHVGPVQLVGDHIGLAVPLVPFQAGVIIPVLGAAAHKHALGYLGVVPRRGDKLVRHAVANADFFLFGVIPHL